MMNEDRIAEVLLDRYLKSKECPTEFCDDCPEEECLNREKKKDEDDDSN